MQAKPTWYMPHTYVLDLSASAYTCESRNMSESLMYMHTTAGSKNLTKSNLEANLRACVCMPYGLYRQDNLLQFKVCLGLSKKCGNSVCACMHNKVLVLLVMFDVVVLRKPGHLLCLVRPHLGVDDGLRWERGMCKKTGLCQLLVT